MTPTAQSLDALEDKLAAGRRLTRQDGLAIFASADLAALGRIADAARRRRHGLRTWYVVNTHVNYTNVCVNRCDLCAFYRDEGDAEAYLLSPDEVVARAAPDLEAGATEVHVVGGLHPEVGLDYYLAVIGGLHEAFPRVSIQALTAVEVARAAETSGLAVREVLARLKEAGLTGLPGGGAEIFDSGVRRRICPNKISGEEWLAVHRQAHALGLPTNATMLYGHLEEPEHRVDHLLALRAAQDETGGFQAFIPLAFHPQGTRLGSQVGGTATAEGRDRARAPDTSTPTPTGVSVPPPGGPTAYDDLKTMAAARLLLDNVPHVKAFWIMLGEDTAQVALRFGADDIDGTVVREEITHAAGARTPQGLTPDRIEHLVRAAGCEPVERDTLYRRIKRGQHFSQWERSDS